MKRRKFIAGLGVLSAGGSAVLGTSAVSSVTAQRNIGGTVAGDKSAYLKIQKGSNNGFAVKNLDGQFRLGFNDDPDGGNGLNPDAVSSFDDVFQILNTGSETLLVHIEDSKDRIEFYFGESASDGTFKDSDTAKVALGPGAEKLRVGVRIDLRGLTAASGVFEGDNDFTIVAEDADPLN
jgi:hypothetical protein